MNTYPVSVSQQFVFNSKQSALTARASIIASALSGLAALSPDWVEGSIAGLDESSLSRMIVTDNNCRVVYDSSQSDPLTGKISLCAEIVKASRGYDVFSAVYDQDAFQCAVAVPVMRNNSPTGVVYLFELDTEQARLLGRLRSDLRNISILIALIALVFSYFASRALSNRVARLLRAMNHVGTGDYSLKAPVRGNDELAALAKGFNDLTGRLQKTEEARRRFVSDASHELKTPLASIRLLADSILQTDDIPQDATREFIGDISFEIDRLSRLTEKLMRLSRLEAAQTDGVEPIDLAETARRAARLLQPLADKRGVELRLELSRANILAGADDAYQIVFNLLENAVKYTNKGGSVTVFSYEKERKACLIVDDTGIGIPAEDIPRLFERFYRVDKARSSDAGGAGLGLSIVALTVAAYGGTITIESEQGKGSRFSVSFPAP